MAQSDYTTKKCPRCGYEDIGKYCSQCSHPLDKELTNVFSEMYHAFFLRFFYKHRAFMRFARTWWRAFSKPGTIDLKKSYQPNPRYMSDIKFAYTVFLLAIGATFLKSIFTLENGKENFLAGVFMNWIFHTYILWIFCFTLLAFIWTGRLWRRWMRMEVKDQRHYDSIFVYEYGMLIAIVFAFSFFFGPQVKELFSSAFSVEGAKRVPPLLTIVAIVLAVVSLVQFLWLFLSVGLRAGLPMKRLILVSLLSIYLFPFIAFGAEIITLPIALLPLLVILSPIFFLSRHVYRKLKT